MSGHGGRVQCTQPPELNNRAVELDCNSAAVGLGSRRADHLSGDPQGASSPSELYHEQARSTDGVLQQPRDGTIELVGAQPGAVDDLFHAGDLMQSDELFRIEPITLARLADVPLEERLGRP
jgi:hypothetical protein